MITQTRFRAMGNTVVVELDDAHAGLAAHAKQRIKHLEQRWSRFEPSSDISRLNASASTPVAVADETVLLVQHLIAATALTGRLFDPTVLPAVIAAGYGASLDSALTTHLPRAAATGHDLAQVVFAGATITVPASLTLDPGGLGKGLAADLVVGELMDAGAAQVCVSAGGDIAFAGTPRRIDVVSPFSDNAVAAVAFERGGVATSSVTAKTFASYSGLSHHIIDPATLAPVAHDVCQATVLASSCAWAEALATATLVAGTTALVDSLGIGALLVHRNGSLTRSMHWSEL